MSVPISSVFFLMSSSLRIIPNRLNGICNPDSELLTAVITSSVVFPREIPSFSRIGPYLRIVSVDFMCDVYVEQHWTIMENIEKTLITVAPEKEEILKQFKRLKKKIEQKRLAENSPARIRTGVAGSRVPQD